jgi:hypothetical protein
MMVTTKNANNYKSRNFVFSSGASKIQYYIFARRPAWLAPPPPPPPTSTLESPSARGAASSRTRRRHDHLPVRVFEQFQ